VNGENVKRNIKILLVEDNLDDRKVIRHVLEKAFAGVVILDTGSRDTAYQELKSNTYDIILTDLHLQGFTGWDVVADVRKLGLQVPVILITGDWETETVLNALMLQVDDYIVKTAKYINRLPQIIGRVLRQAPLEKIRRTSKDDLEHTLQSYKEVFEKSEELIQSLWPDCSIMNVNNAWCETLGYKKADIPSINFLDMLHDVSKNAFNEVLGEISKGRTMQAVDLLINRKNSGIAYVKATGTALMVNGRSVATHWVFKDISAEKNLQILLRESQDQYMSALEYAPTPLLLSDPKGIVIKVNNAACELFGYTAEELLGNHIKDMTHPEDLEMSLNLHKKLLLGDIDNIVMEKRYRHKAGQYIWVKVTASLVRNNHGLPRYSVVQLEHISARKKVEEIVHS